MRKPVIGKRRSAAAPLPDREMPAGLSPLPAIPATTPLAPSPSIPEPELRAILAQLLAGQRTLEQRLAQLSISPLTPEILAGIENRAVERVAPLILTVMQRLTGAVSASALMFGQIEEAGAEIRRQIRAMTEEAQANIRALGVETRAEVDALHKAARAEMRRTQHKALGWTRRLSRYTQTQLSGTARAAIWRLEASTTEARKAARWVARTTVRAKEVSDGFLSTAASVEAAAEAIVDMSPVRIQAAEIRAREIARETGLTILTGLALMIVVIAAALAALWYFGPAH